MVQFRQGTMEAQQARNTYANKRQYTVDPTTGSFVELQAQAPDELASLEVFLTLSDTDIQLPNGDSLRFDSAEGVRRVADRVQFNKWWGALPIQWAQLIYQLCLEVNIDWNPKRN
jgi:hypothetical protein